MSPATQRALLQWFHENGGPAIFSTAHHTMHWSGAAALAACVTEQDYQVVADAMELASVIVQATPVPDILRTSPDVQFNGNHATLRQGGQLIAEAYF